ncbi:MAG: type II toxin-antitoxin system PemK/MazF family toxin [Acidimicrobiia bacterium]|nr:type II toxin-antitoxin system PemK/MazF family toxin [Acidimicrobiia bacterium]MYC58075.1 type II toxin-antitoxin system PemK/MazF family toxin [Acidimicrobiia bacterium]MYI30752.1 type II toxin-antitoxin system PemK/MazF family toxin [Acidimicrobiia bacterium]
MGRCRGQRDDSGRALGALVIVSQYEIWWAENEAKARPVLVVSRNEAIPVLDAIMVAPITRTIRGISTEVALDIEDGLPQPCVANCDNLQLMRKSYLVERIGAISHRRYEICIALNAVANC